MTEEFVSEVKQIPHNDERIFTMLSDLSNLERMVAIFTYGFPVAEAAFKDAKVTLTTLSNYDAVLEEAVRTHYIDESEIAVLQEWRKDPANWDPK